MGKGARKSRRSIERRAQELQVLAPAALDKPELAAAPTRDLWPKRRALLIINTKSGPNHDSILRVRQVVESLASFGISADVRVKLRKSQARKVARRYARRHRRGVIVAAGGDGTVEAVAAGLVGTRATLGILPMGTYNNVATSLGIPSDLPEAMALIASHVRRAIDVGVVEAKYSRKPRLFLEVGTVGIGATRCWRSLHRLCRPAPEVTSAEDARAASTSALADPCRWRSKPNWSASHQRDSAFCRVRCQSSWALGADSCDQQRMQPCRLRAIWRTPARRRRPMVLRRQDPSPSRPLLGRCRLWRPPLPTSGGVPPHRAWPRTC